jgi:hypothetical protein
MIGAPQYQITRLKRPMTGNGAVMKAESID